MNVARRVAAGNFTDSIATSRRDELGSLLRSLGSMRSRLRARAEEEHQRALANEGLARMHAALSASSEAMMRAKTREQLYQLVCQAVAEGGEFASISIALADEENKKLVVVAAQGPCAEEVKKLDLAITDDRPEGRGLTGTAFRSRQPCVSNDYLANDQFAAFHDSFRRFGVRSAVAMPLLSRSEATGVIAFQATELNYFSPEMIELLGRLATNVSLTLEDFDRAEERERAEEEMRHLATHDSLTDLPNRALFSELLGFSMTATERYQRKCAVLFIDLDRFKIINDSLGHEQGDVLLIEIARRLKASVRASDVVARLGGDEFVVLLNEITDQKQVAGVAKNLLCVLGKPVDLAGQECGVTASIGVAMFPDDGSDQEQLLKNADVAMYLAKQEGKDDVRFYSNNIKTPSADRIKIEAHLRRALERNELFLEYQPKQSTETGKMIGVEALLRWQSPELGLLAPIQFIPLAEETGMIVPIGRWVLHTACRQAADWQRDGLPPLSMAVNFSPRQFSDGNLLNDIDNALAESGLDPALLQIEITESMVMINVEQAIQILGAIQSRGVRLAIDDFGTGYSSMSVMKHFPIDTIKIDRSFVRDLPRDARNKAITQAIIRMGKALGLVVVAEGVETIEQNAFLHLHECDEIQGFYYSKPVSSEAVIELCQRNMLEHHRVVASM
jgi:diguanylate cyclase (GGDEF)-like protein